MDIRTVLDDLKPIEYAVVSTLPSEGLPGVIYRMGIDEWMYMNNIWNQIGSVDLDVSTVDDVKVNRPHLTNCKNCGAVLKGNRCEYCGTTYE